MGRFLRALCGALVAALFASHAEAAVMNGKLSGSGLSGWSVTLTFACTLNGTTCTGFATGVQRDPGCTNSLTIPGTVTVTGLNLTQVGPFSANLTTTNQSWSSVLNPDNSCTYTLGPTIVEGFPLTGTFDGAKGTVRVTGIDFWGDPFHLDGPFYADSPVGTPVFPMAVNGSVGASVSNIQANIQPRPQDVGTNAKIYVFAMAPATIVHAAAKSESAAIDGMRDAIPGFTTAKLAPKDTPVQCVLAQLNASGQLQAVSASSLQAYVNTVLTAQNQVVTILNGVPTATIGGATFYVGYGTSSSAMIDNGVNRGTVTVPAAQECRPEPPQTGWWWNPAEGGRGFSVEVSGDNIFFASFLYDVSGRSTWYAAAGPTSLNSSLFTGALLSYSGGQTLGGPYPGRPVQQNAGTITLAFNTATTGTMIWPGGTVPIERFNIVPNGLSATPLSTQPQNGWWWDPTESGRGFFMEWQGGSAFIAAYMYDTNGNPLWYLTNNTTPSSNLQSYSNNWAQYGNGQTLIGAYRPASVVNSNVAPVTIQFNGAETAIMTLPNGRTTHLTRFRF